MVRGGGTLLANQNKGGSGSSGEKTSGKVQVRRNYLAVQAGLEWPASVRCSGPAGLRTTKNHSWILRVGRDVSVLISRRDWTPVVKIQLAVAPAAGRRRGAAVLLGSVYPVRKSIVGAHVVRTVLSAGCTRNSTSRLH